MADTKISDLPEATALTGAELFLASQSAADVQASLQRLRDELDWVRPADWPAMPASAANTIHILAAVHDHASNLAAMRISVSTGTWSINWGDGVTNSGIASRRRTSAALSTPASRCVMSSSRRASLP
jgi:chitinase